LISEDGIVMTSNTDAKDYTDKRSKELQTSNVAERSQYARGTHPKRVNFLNPLITGFGT
jgi:hypothetical protein